MNKIIHFLVALMLAVGIAYAQDAYYVARVTTIACQSEEFMEIFLEAIRTKDTDSAKAGMIIAMISDECEVIEEGRKLHLSELRIFSSLDEVIVPGKLGKYYVIDSFFEIERTN